MLKTAVRGREVRVEFLFVSAEQSGRSVRWEGIEGNWWGRKCRRVAYETCTDPEVAEGVVAVFREAVVDGKDDDESV